MLKALLSLLLAGAMLVMLPGCGEGSVATSGTGSGSTTAPAGGVPTNPPDIQGTITNASQDSILVEENPGQADGSGKILLRLTGNTRILRSDGSAASRADLTAGQKVRAWVTGPVSTSYPEQGEAATVVIDQ